MGVRKSNAKTLTHFTLFGLFLPTVTHLGSSVLHPRERANLFHEASITLILKPDEDHARKVQTIIHHGQSYKITLIALKLQTKSSIKQKAYYIMILWGLS